MAIDPTINRRAGIAGISAVLLFAAALLLFGTLHPEFDFFQDYISYLGAIGEPNAIWWNVIGFFMVGILLMFFGIQYGRIVEDRLAGILLSLFGLGFAFTAIPVDKMNEASAVSKAHIVAICLGLAFWMFGLARLSYKPRLGRSIQRRASISAIILVAAIAGLVVDLWSMPMTHRLVFAVVFGWTAITGVELLKGGTKKFHSKRASSYKQAQA